MAKRLTTADFIEKARQVHGDKYDYSKVNYINDRTKVCIICPKHGEFWQRPSCHLQGKGCYFCGLKMITTTEEFIEKAKQAHGDRYDYSKTNYINSQTKVCIICPEHGEFWQFPKTHLRGKGCKKCGIQSSLQKQTMTVENFIKRARQVHGDKYDYSKVEYVNSQIKVCIICPEHGEFWQRPNHHLMGNTCPKCAKKIITLKATKSQDKFIEEAYKMHGDKYDYSKVHYINKYTPVCIICPEHGEFWQRPDNHLRGTTCPKCSHHQSKPEQEIIEYLKQFLKPEQIRERDRELLDGREVDILLPDFHVGIEYNGLYWHNIEHKPEINYHRDKMRLANSKGYRLIQIFEDEWLEHQEIVLNKLRHVINADVGECTIGARKCTVRQINKQIAEGFLDIYHIQGFVGSSIYLGAYHNDELIGVMSLKEEKPMMWNLTRFATKTDYKLPGLASKMFKYFTKNYEFDEIKSFLDLRWNQSLNGNTVYDKLGFVLEKIERPDYRYAVGSQRLHKFGFRKQTLHKKYGLPLTMTEREMCDKLGFIRIYDCGLAKYVYKQKEAD